MYPMKFQPIYKNYLWGGRNLDQLGKKLPAELNVAESWEVSCHPDGLSVVANGSLSGQTLSELLKTRRSELAGTAVQLKYGTKFPLLVKLIDATQKLSVQVHPDDAYALTQENEFGKHEIWYIINAQPGAQIIYGLLPGITQAEFERRIEAGEVESCLHYLPVAAGDVIDIPPGTVHALGEGILLAEIQQNSNTTYRVYDYDRTDASGLKRPLHVAKALEVIDFDAEVGKTVAASSSEPLSAASTKQVLTVNWHFEVDLYQIKDEVTEMASGERFYIYTLLEGEGQIRWGANKIPICQGESVMIPAQLGKYHLNGTWKGLKSFVTTKLKTVEIT